ncbi:multisubstrate pseudouridine synthase 7 [Microbotryomycetes sp. JL201]|nr:multisubstrate pseudouridine synthase 7 [Microbotryomycetes sp. JL201]
MTDGEPAAKRVRLDANVDGDTVSTSIGVSAAREQPQTLTDKTADEPTPAIPAWTDRFRQERGLFKMFAQQGKQDQTQCTEDDVGVTEYADGDCLPFKGIIKHRHVLYQYGKVARLTDIKGPQQQKGKRQQQQQDPSEAINGDSKPKNEVDAASPPVTWSDTEQEAFSPILSSSKLDDFRAFIERGSPPNGTSRGSPEYLFQTNVIEGKAARTSFHEGVRNAFDGRLSTELRNVPDVGQVIQVSWRPAHSTQRSDRMSKEEYFAQRNSLPPYIHFTLHKVNKEMHDALNGLSRQLKLGPKDLGIAGTKDKRAITTQRISFKRGNKTVEEVWRAARGGGGGGGRGRGGFRGNNGGPDRGVRIGDVGYASTHLDLGMLKGNKFIVTLRDVKADSPAVIERAMASLRARGFINYFGMQRFGTGPIPTHAIGLALMRSDWDLAVELILRPRSGEQDDLTLARQLWAEGKKEDAFRTIPRRAIAERAVMEGLLKNSKDPLAALSKVPKNLRLMYVHSWQSYVWNQIASERIKLHGCLNPVVGDLVYAEPVANDDAPDEASAAPANLDATPILSTVESLDPDLDEGKSMRALCYFPSAQDLQAADADIPTPSTGPINAVRATSISRLPKVKSLTQDDISAGTYSIFDVILPMPGYAVTYPTNELGARYRQIMQDDGLDPDALFRHQKEYSMGGTYRRIMHLPTDVSHKLLIYTSPNQDLAQSDEDVLLGKPKPEIHEVVINKEKMNEWPAEAAGKTLALQVEMSLGSSTYCTMALREIMKVRTSNVHQRMLTEQMEERVKREQLAGVASTTGESKVADDAKSAPH